MGCRIHPTYQLRVVRGDLNGRVPRVEGTGGTRRGILVSLYFSIPWKPCKSYNKIACLNVRGYNRPAKRECVGSMFEERGLDVLVLSEIKLRGMTEQMFGNVVGRVSGVSSGSARKGVCIIVGDEWRRCVRK